MANNEVRIIGGQWRGRKLRFPARNELRPTLGRVRETLFNWLAPVIAGARCLDLFAGSGALGFEALSRGAAEVTFVEKDRKAAHALRDNIAQFSAAGIVVNRPAIRFLNSNPDRYDIIFLDPPFADPSAAGLLERLLNRHLEADGLIYWEASAHSALPAGGRLHRQGQAGDCAFALIAPGVAGDTSGEAYGKGS